MSREADRARRISVVIYAHVVPVWLAMNALVLKETKCKKRVTGNVKV
jgi:hypothetical protein